MASPAGLAGSGGGSVTRDGVAGVDAIAGSRIVRAAIVDLAVEDQRLEARARQRRNARGEHAVEPLAGLLGGDRDGLAGAVRCMSVMSLWSTDVRRRRKPLDPEAARAVARCAG